LSLCGWYMYSGRWWWWSWWWWWWTTGEWNKDEKRLTLSSLPQKWRTVYIDSFQVVRQRRAIEERGREREREREWHSCARARFQNRNEELCEHPNGFSTTVERMRRRLPRKLLPEFGKTQYRRRGRINSRRLHRAPFVISESAINMPLGAPSHIKKFTNAKNGILLFYFTFTLYRKTLDREIYFRYISKCIIIKSF